MGEKVKKEMATQFAKLLRVIAHARAAPRLRAHAAMALAALSGDEQCVIFSQLCNPLDAGVAVAFGSTSSELRAVTQAPRQQLRADHEAAAALFVPQDGEGELQVAAQGRPYQISPN